MVVPMRDGPFIREAALRLALRLEDAGHELRVKDGALTVTHGSQLSAADREAIRMDKSHLCALIAYCQR